MYVTVYNVLEGRWRWQEQKGGRESQEASLSVYYSTKRPATRYGAV